MNNIFTKLLKQTRSAWLVVLAIVLWSSASMAQVSVTATAGILGPTNYATVQAAFAAINAGTHKGTIVLSITANTTETTPAVQLLASGVGLSSYTSIKITPTGGVNRVINSAATPTASRAILEFVGADNVTIDGDDAGVGGTAQNLSIIVATTANASTACLRFSSSSTTTNGCTGCTVKNCIITGGRNLSTSGTASYGIFCGLSTAASTITTLSGSADNDNMTIQNNLITKCFYGIYCYGLASPYLMDNLIIKGNTIGPATATTSNVIIGITTANTQIAASAASAQIDGNDISVGETVSGYGGLVAGVNVLLSNAGIIIKNNKIHDIYNPSAGGWQAHGISISSSATNNGGISIFNNFIYKVVAYHYISGLSQYTAHGIYISVGATGLKIDHNSINMSTPNAGSGTINSSFCLLSNSAAATYTSFQNNILVNTMSDNTLQFCGCVYFAVTTNASLPVTMDKNDYYITGASGYIGGFNGLVYNTLSAWQGVSARDAASYNVNPPFTSATDLHIPAATISGLESGGNTLAGVTVDIDNDARPGPAGSINGGASASDVGADEFDGALPVCAGTPTAGTISCAPASVCYGLATTMSLGGGSSFPGTAITNQWQYSSNGGATWTNWTGQTGVSLAILVVSSTNQYRCVVTCTTTGLFAATPGFSPGMTSPPSVATIPYTQDFESWISVCTATDAPDIYSRTCTPYLTPLANALIRRDDDVASVPWTNPALGGYSPVSFTGAHSARFHKYSLANTNQGFIDFWVDLSAGGPANPTTIMLDYICTSGFAYGLNVSTDNGLTFTLLTASPSLITTPIWRTITSSTTANSATTLFRIVFQATGAATTDIGLDNLRIFPACSGAPAMATITPSQNPVCVGTNYQLTAGGLGNTGNFFYDWQSSLDGGATWLDLGGGFNIFSGSQAAATTYRVLVTCVTSGLTTTSNTLLMTMYSPAYVPYFGYTQNFESWVSACSVTDVPSVNWKTTPAIGNNASPGICGWRRDDQGASGNWYTPELANGMYAPAFTVGAHSARFHTYSVAAGNIESMDLYMNCTGSGGALTMTFDYINTGGTDLLRIYVSTNGGATFVQSGANLGVQATWGNKSFAIASASATTIIRFQATGDWGLDDIGVDNLVIVGPCAGTPTAGTGTAAPASVCSGSPVTLTLTGAAAGSGITYQWQSSPDNITWTNIGGATNSVSVITQLSNSYYRCAVTCVPSTSTAYTVATPQITTTSPITYATLPYTQSFETWVNACGVLDRPNDNHWLTNPSAGNTSWKREDDASLGGALSGGNWTTGAYGGPSAVATVGVHAAKFYTYLATAGLSGIMDLYIDCSTSGGAIGVSYDMINHNDAAAGFPGYDLDILEVWGSTDGGGTFSLLQSTQGAPGWTSKNLSYVTSSATTVIRFKATSDFGYTNIGLDNVSVGPTCSGTPVAGTINTSANPVCDGATSFTLSLTGATNGGGIVFQWQSAAVNVSGSFTDIVGATNSSYTGVQATPSWYRCVVTCTTGGASATQGAGATLNETMVAGASYAALPYSQSFEAWTTNCATTDRPGANWLNSPYTGDNSWRRDDQGASASWAFNAGAYTPASSIGAHSARFDTYSASFGTTGDLDLYVNATGSGGNIGLSFDFTNAADGDVDYMRIDYSTDGGSTFTTGLATLGQTGAWAGYNYLIPSSSATTIIRFHCWSDFGLSDMGLDNVAVALSCSGTPAPGATLSSSGIGVCPATPFTLSTANNMSSPGITFQWQSAPVPGLPASYTNIAGATNSTYAGSQLVETYYRCYIVCTNGGGNATSTALDLIMNPFYLCYGVPGNGGTCFEDITNVTLNTINNNTTCSPNNYSQQAATTSLQQGSNYVGSMTTDGFWGNAITGVWIDYNQNGVFDVTEFCTPQPMTNATSGVITVNVPITATVGLTGMRVRSNWSIYTMTASDAGTPSFEGETEDYVITITAAPLCSGTPAASTTVSSANPTAIGGSYTLSLTGLGLSGLLFQWQSSGDNVTWTDVSGATNTTYSSVGTVNTYYRCLVKCSVSGLSTPSTSLLQKVNPYCTPFYSSGSGAGDYISRVQIEDNSGSTVLNYGTAGSGVSPYYNDYTVLAPNPDIQAGSFFWLKANPGTWLGYIVMQAWVDWNNDGDFYDGGEWVTYQSSQVTTQAMGTIGGTANTGKIYCEVPSIGAYPGGGVVALGTHRMRVRYLDIVSQGVGSFPMDPCGTYIWGETEDYDLNLVSTCTVASAASQVTSFVPGQTTVNDRIQVTLSSPSVGGLKKFEYSSSPTFATVDGQFIEYGMTTSTTPSFVDNVNLGQIYVRGVYQNEGCAVDNTQTMLIKTSCAPELFFWTNRTLTPYLPSYVHDYISNVKISIGATNYLNNTSAYQNDGYNDFTYISANLDRSVTYTISTTCNGAGAAYSASRAAWLDYNGDGVLQASENIYLSPATGGVNSGTLTGTFSIPCGNAFVGDVILRIMAVYDNPFGTGVYTFLTANPCTGGFYYGEIEEYSVHINEIPELIVSPAASVCAGTSATLKVTGPTAGAVVAGAGPYTWTWLPTTSSLSINPTNLNQNTVANAPINTFYTVTGLLSNSCTATTVVPVTTVPLAGAVTPLGSVVCTGGSQVLVALGAAGLYQWQYSDDNTIWNNIPGATNTTYSTAAFATPNKRYYRLITLSPNCYDLASNTVTVELFTTPVVTISSVTSTSFIVDWTPAGGGNFSVTIPGAPGSPYLLAMPPLSVSGLAPNTNYAATVTKTSLPACLPNTPGTATAKTLCATAPAPTFGATTNGTTVVNIPSGGPSYKVFYKFITLYNNYLSSPTCLAPGSTYTITSQWSGVPISVYLQACDCPTVGLMGQAGPAVIKYLLPGSSTCASPTGPLGVGLFTTGNVVSDCPNRIKVELGGSPTNNYRVTFQRLLPTFAAANTYPVSYSGIMSYTVMNTPLPQVWQVWVVSACGIGGTPPYSVMSEVVQVTVKSGCNKIQNLVLSHPTCHGFTATWNAGDCGLPTTNLLGYSAFVKVGASNWNGYAAPTNVKTGAIWGSGVTIQVYVRANSCNNSFGPASDIQTITTLSGAGCREEDQQVEESLNHDGITNEFGTLSVYPNPNQGQFVMDLQMGDLTSQDVRIDVMNMLGQVVYTQITNISDGHITEGIALSESIASGNYMVRVMAGDKAVFNTRINISK